MIATALTKVTRNGQVTLPASVRRAMSLEVGDYIEVRAFDDGIVLVPKKLIDKSQAYFWSARWQAAEKEATEDIAANRVSEAADIGKVIAHLNKTRKKKS